MSRVPNEIPFTKPSTELKQLFGETRRKSKLYDVGNNTIIIYEEYQTFVARFYEVRGELRPYVYIRRNEDKHKPKAWTKYELGKVE